jgi:hypothetical protein
MNASSRFTRAASTHTPVVDVDVAATSAETAIAIRIRSRRIVTTSFCAAHHDAARSP